jgi:hypothetical protein
MIQLAKIFNKKITYYGFDLFEEITKKEKENELSKYPNSYYYIHKLLKKFTDNVNLYKGNTSSTLKVFSKKYLSTMIELFFKSHERNCSSRTEALLMFMVSYDYLLQSGLRLGMIEVDETIVKDKKKDFSLGTNVSLYLSGLPLDQIKIMHLLNQKSQDWVFSTPSNLIAVAKIISSYLYNIPYPFSLEKQDLKLYQGLVLFSKEWQKNKLKKFFMNEVSLAAQEKVDYERAYLPE